MKSVQIYLIVVIIFLAFFISIEVYFLSLLQSVKVNCKNDPTCSSLAPIPPTPQPGTEAIHPRVLQMMAGYKKDSKSKLTVIAEVETEVEDIDNETKVMSGRKILYWFKLKHDAFSNWHYMPDFLVKFTKVLVSKDDEIVPSSLNEIKIGDTIRTKEVYDPSLPPTDSRHLIENTIIIIR